uniref:DUF982 domain-containing protein n=1 Tax=Neorhizobium sp. EC2-8 TaxID=3129230 RepID=UPI003101066C
MLDPRNWRDPVIYEDGSGQRCKVVSTEQACDILISSWPVSYGMELLRAREIFLDVMSGSRPIAEARAAFVRAAQEADLDICAASRKG